MLTLEEWWNYIRKQSPDFCALKYRVVVFAMCIMCCGFFIFVVTTQRSAEAIYKSSSQFVEDELKDSRRYVIYRCNDMFCGGLADREKGMITAFVLAEMMGRRFGIWMEHPCNLSDYVIPDQIEWVVREEDRDPLTKEYLRNLDGHSMATFFENSDLEEVFRREITYFTGNIDYVPNLMKNILFQNVHWARNLNHHDIYRRAFQKLFKFSPETKIKVENALDGISPSGHLVCAHVRVGKSQTVPNDRVRRKRPDLATLIRFLKRTLQREDTLFIATDSEQVRNVLRKVFFRKYRETPGEIVHIDRSGRSYNCSGLEKALMDQFVLSRCDILVTSASGFSRIAAILRGTDDKLFLAIGDKIIPTKRLNPT